MIQNVVWSISIVFMGALAAVFIWIALGASTALENYGPAIAAAYRKRTWLFVIALVVLIGGNYQSLRQLPYVSSVSAAESTADVQPAEIIGEQWSWTATPSNFRVGQTVEFHVTSKDVNHGFGLYDPEMRMVTQTQAMPGYINRVRYTFKTPGTYQIMCLEYCGVAHHQMTADITVAAR